MPVKNEKACIIVVPGEVDPGNRALFSIRHNEEGDRHGGDGGKKMGASAEEEKEYEIIKTPLKKYVWRSGDVVEIPMICADKHGNIVPPPKHEDLMSTFAIAVDGDAKRAGYSRSRYWDYRQLQSKRMSTDQVRWLDSVLPRVARTHCSSLLPITKRNGGIRRQSRMAHPRGLPITLDLVAAPWMVQNVRRELKA